MELSSAHCWSGLELALAKFLPSVSDGEYEKSPNADVSYLRNFMNLYCKIDYLVTTISQVEKLWNCCRASGSLGPCFLMSKHKDLVLQIHVESLGVILDECAFSEMGSHRFRYQ